MSERDWKALAQITEFALTRDMARLSEVNARLQALKIARLSLSHTAVAEMPKPGRQAPSDLVSYAKWQRWSDQSRTQLDVRETAEKALREQAMVHLRRSFGQTTAVTRLQKEDAIKAKNARIARAERDGRPSEE